MKVSHVDDFTLITYILKL